MGRKEKPSVSPLRVLLDHVWSNTNQATEHAWNRLNCAMRDALKLAIEAGFEFRDDDFAAMFQANYRTGHWVGESDEWIYALAIRSANYTAATSFEAYKKRIAFIADDVTCGRYQAPTRQRERLAVGFRFPYKGRDLTVTSFAADGETLTACSYKPELIPKRRKAGRRVVLDGAALRPEDVDEGMPTNKVDKRFTISRTDIIAERREKKDRDILIRRLAELPPVAMATVIRELGIKSDREAHRLPLAKLRNFADKYAPIAPAEAK